LKQFPIAKVKCIHSVHELATRKLQRSFENANETTNSNLLTTTRRLSLLTTSASREKGRDKQGDKGDDGVSRANFNTDDLFSKNCQDSLKQVP